MTGYCLYLLISCGFGICLLCVVVFFVCGLFLTAFGDLLCDVVCLGSLCRLGVFVLVGVLFDLAEVGGVCVWVGFMVTLCGCAL